MKQFLTATTKVAKGALMFTRPLSVVATVMFITFLTMSCGGRTSANDNSSDSNDTETVDEISALAQNTALPSSYFNRWQQVCNEEWQVLTIEIDADTIRLREVGPFDVGASYLGKYKVIDQSHCEGEYGAPVDEEDMQGWSYIEADLIADPLMNDVQDRKAHVTMKMRPYKNGLMQWCYCTSSNEDVLSLYLDGCIYMFPTTGKNAGTWPAINSEYYGRTFKSLIYDIASYDFDPAWLTIRDCIREGSDALSEGEEFEWNPDEYWAKFNKNDEYESGLIEINGFSYDNDKDMLMVINNRDSDMGYKQLTFYKYDSKTNTIHQLTEKERPFDDFIGNKATDVEFEMSYGRSYFYAHLSGLDMTVTLDWDREKQKFVPRTEN